MKRHKRHIPDIHNLNKVLTDVLIIHHIIEKGCIPSKYYSCVTDMELHCESFYHDCQVCLFKYPDELIQYCVDHNCISEGYGLQLTLDIKDAGV